MTNLRTCSLDWPWYGCSASVLISHSTTPNDLANRRMRDNNCDTGRMRTGQLDIRKSKSVCKHFNHWRGRPSAEVQLINWLICSGCYDPSWSENGLNGNWLAYTYTQTPNQKCHWPAVWMCSEDSVLKRLRCHPPDGQQALPALPVVVGLVDVSCHTKVWQEKISFTSCRQI